MTHKFIEMIQSQFPAGFLTQDKAELINFGRDWTRHYDPAPLAVVFPKSIEEVSRFLKLCFENQIAVVPSGGRTGLSAGAVAANGEIVLSLSRMNRIGELNETARTLEVEAGAITEAIHIECAKKGLTWPVDFASKGSSTVGGNIATNAGGVKVVRYGLTREWVMGLKVCLMNGDILNLNGSLIKNNTGYDLRQLFIGSEGTLGVVCEATLKLTRLPSSHSVFFFALDQFDSVLKLFEKAQNAPARLSAFETLSDACLKNVLKVRGLSQPFIESHPVYALVEFEDEFGESDLIRTRLEEWLASLFEDSLAIDGVLAETSEHFKTIWAYREGISESLSSRGFVHKNDIALPISKLSIFLKEFLSQFESKYPQFEVFVFGHIGDGNLHLNVLKPDAMKKDEFLKETHTVDELLFSILKKQGGSVSAEHGIGLVKKWALPYSRTPEEIALFRSIKKVFDPKNLLNPGKIF